MSQISASAVANTPLMSKLPHPPAVREDLRRGVWADLAQERVEPGEVGLVPADTAFRHPRALRHDELRGDAILFVRKFPIVGVVFHRPGLQRERPQTRVGDAEIGAVQDGYIGLGDDVVLERRALVRALATCRPAN